MDWSTVVHALVAAIAVAATYHLGNRNRLIEKQRLENEMQRFRAEQQQRLSELIHGLEHEYRRLLVSEKIAAYKDIGPAFGKTTEVARRAFRQVPFLPEWDQNSQTSLRSLHEAIARNLHIVDRRLAAAYTRFDLSVANLRTIIPGASHATEAGFERSVAVSGFSAASDRFVEVMREDLGVRQMEAGELRAFLFPHEMGSDLSGIQNRDPPGRA